MRALSKVGRVRFRSSPLLSLSIPPPSLPPPCRFLSTSSSSFSAPPSPSSSSIVVLQECHNPELTPQESHWRLLIKALVSKSLNIFAPSALVAPSRQHQAGTLDLGIQVSRGPDTRFDHDGRVSTPSNDALEVGIKTNECTIGARVDESSDGLRRSTTFSRHDRGGSSGRIKMSGALGILPDGRVSKPTMGGNISGLMDRGIPGTRSGESYHEGGLGGAGGWEKGPTRQADADLKIAAPSIAFLFRASCMDVVSHLLPKGYPRTVPKGYSQYAKYQMLAMTASSAAGVLSTQSLFYAMGIGLGGLPFAAALNWVIKDGLGQLGGVLFASLVNLRFDADPKRWRIVSALSLDIAILIEVTTPLIPVLFIPLAATANGLKNVSCLAASATRAGIHGSFARKANLADITAKTGSQMITASLVGLGGGVILSPLIGPNPLHIFPALAVLSALHLSAVMRSLSAVSLRTLNVQRADIVATSYFHHFIDGRKEHNKEEETGEKRMKPSSFGSSSSSGVLKPSEVASHEAIIGRNGRYLIRGNYQGENPWVLEVAPDFNNEFAFLFKDHEKQQRAEEAYMCVGNGYVLSILSKKKAKEHGNEDALRGEPERAEEEGEGRGEGGEVALWFIRGASRVDLITGVLHAVAARETLRSLVSTPASSISPSPSPSSILDSTKAFAECETDTFRQALIEAGWDVQNLQLEERDGRRVDIME